MAFQIRRAHRLLPSPQDLIALRTSNRTKRKKGPGTLFFVPPPVFNPEERSPK